MSTRMMRVVVGGLALVVAAGCASMGEKKLTTAEAIDARKQLMKERQETSKASVQAKLEELKGKLHHGKQDETDDADRAPATAGSPN